MRQHETQQERLLRRFGGYIYCHLEWQGYYSLRRGIATQLNSITRDPMAAKGLLRHSSVNTTLTHYIKSVPEVTANGMAQVEQLFSAAAGQAVQ
jgi:hypothetical protein